ncbi:MAG: sulfotransferase [Bacteroidia bacterium]
MANKQPNLFLIGGMRCGSTSLHFLLSQHPEIFMSKVKEPMYYNAEYMRSRLDADDALKDKLQKFEARGKYRTTEAYRSLFKEANSELFLGESSHYLYNPAVAETIYRDEPQSRILISIRNPIDRIFSEYQYYQRENPNELSFEEFAFENCEFDEEGSIVSIKSRLNKSFYSKNIAQWIARFGREKVMVILFDNLKTKPKETIRNIYNWLDLDVHFEPTLVHTEKSGKVKNQKVFEKFKKFSSASWIRNLLSEKQRKKLRSWFYQKSLSKQEMAPETRLKLNSIFKEEIDELEQLVQINLEHWKN